MRQPTWDETKDVFFSYLSHDETILWAGKPVSGLRLCRQDAYMIPFSLYCIVFAILWIEAPPKGVDPWLVELTNAPPVIVAIYVAVGRFFADSFIRRTTYYAVTNERVLILRRWPRERLTSLGLTTLPELKLEEEEDGSGTVFFGRRRTFPHYEPPQLRMIDRAGYVCHLIRITRDQLKAAAEQA